MTNPPLEDEHTDIPSPPLVNGGAHAKSHDSVALVLTISLAICLLVVTVAVAWVAVDGDRALGEEGSRLLMVLLGGLLGILGSYLGFHTGKKNGNGGTT
jgi:hypothetical protein